MTKSYLLIVEDDLTLAETMRAKFIKTGFFVKIISDGNLVMKSISSKLPDIIVLDILLPNKNGLDILTELQSDPLSKDIPVVIASNLDSYKDQAKGCAMGADDYIVKSNLSLVDMVNRVLFALNNHYLLG